MAGALAHATDETTEEENDGLITLCTSFHQGRYQKISGVAYDT